MASYIIHSRFESLIRLWVGFDTFYFSLGTLFSRHWDFWLHTFHSNKSSLGVAFGSHSLDSRKFILWVFWKRVKFIIRVFITLSLKSICISKSIDRMVSRLLSRTDTSNHNDLIFMIHLNKRVSKNQSEFALSERNMISLLTHGSDTFFKCQKGFIDLSSFDLSLFGVDLGILGSLWSS